MSHVFEALFTFDGDFNPIPLLAEGHALADGGRRYTITLRKGVRFHNGKELTAADVVASLNRWGALAVSGRSLWKWSCPAPSETDHVTDCLVAIAAVADGAIAYAALPRIRAPTASARPLDA